jgi:hypothetical protein
METRLFPSSDDSDKKEKKTLKLSENQNWDNNLATIWPGLFNYASFSLCPDSSSI